MKNFLYRLLFIIILIIEVLIELPICGIYLFLTPIRFIVTVCWLFTGKEIFNKFDNIFCKYINFLQNFYLNLIRKILDNILNKIE